MSRHTRIIPRHPTSKGEAPIYYEAVVPPIPVSGLDAPLLVAIPCNVVEFCEAQQISHAMYG